VRERGPESPRLTIAAPPSPHGCGVRPRREHGPESSRLTIVMLSSPQLTCEAKEGARSRVVTIDDCDATITVRCEAEVGARFRVAMLKQMPMPVRG